MSYQTQRDGQGFGGRRSDREPATPQPPPMSNQDMMAVIKTAKSGDRLELVFADRTFNGDLKGRLYFIIAMAPPVGNALRFGEMDLITLMAVADSGHWHGFYKYTVTVLADFDADHFIRRTIGRELLDSVCALPVK